MAEETSRREFSKRALQSLLTFSLLDTLFVHDVFGEEVKALAAKWVADLNQLVGDVKDEKIKQIEWQKKVEELLAKVDLPDLLRLVDFDKLTQKIKYKEKGERSLRFQFKEIEGIPTKLVFGKQIFALKKGRSVAPHGHNNMATAFFILKGKLHGRHFQRLEDEREHLIIRPTIDEKFGPGKFSTISDYKDNIHWFTAESERAFIFNFHVLGIGQKTSGKKTGRIYLDPQGEKLKGGRIRARRLTYKEAYKLYG
ncbi:MAG: hypothetical protein O7J95_00605 [Planctomycetota bacterium]|nr:hypothetical protein [Planctomycetota bacterium]